MALRSTTAHLSANTVDSELTSHQQGLTLVIDDQG